MRLKTLINRQYLTLDSFSIIGLLSDFLNKDLDNPNTFKFY
jgi:hypothetical protein